MSGRARKTIIGGAMLLLGGLLPFLGPDAGAQTPPTARQEYAPAQVAQVEDADVKLGYDGVTERVISRPGASFIKVHFERMLLAEGDYVTVSSMDGRENRRYDNGDTWATSVSGDKARLTLHLERPIRESALLAKLPAYGVTVDKISRGFSAEEAAAHAPRHEESLCGGDDKKDAVCYAESDPQVYQHTEPVARLLINGTTLCTAWRVGAQNRMLTNHHCFETTRDARATEVWFGYECRVCGGGATREPVKVLGDEVLSTDQNLDYTLFTVQDFEAIKDFGFLELDDRVATKGEKLYIPQHPSGEPLKLSVDSDSDEGGYCRVDSPKYQGYQADTDVSYYCDTEFGSSGSPVLARSTHKVIALHHFGGCPNSGVRADLLMNAIGEYI
ncbi:hypothetical protein Afil01_17560 [Actinorhabdospora filicis]|uniref:V8-like Glu-specific endopeptidase n=1 Tax=Actinorhabdospora filicis TaxID=1785913 RepID=A0A9W6SGY2_9ACTN|nr:serine protease [Actinorhabdospora filicis]GLZ76949.1 hypothetical protein Afil01_17560 [Actinorhabdospora filicis]